MSLFCCNNRQECLGVSLVISLLVGVVTAFLTFAAVIAVTPAFLWVVFGIAVAFLALALVTAPLLQGSASRCLCSTLTALLIGVLGTVFFAILLLAISFAATSIIGAILTGVLLFFFVLVLTSAACLVRCIVNCNN